MAMVVENNMGTQRTLNTLNKNNKKLSKAFSKVSSGMKIVGAGDGASEYAISEKMREQIRSLDQDSQNVQNGQSLFKIAAGGIDNIVEELRTLKELAIKSANDTNTDGDRLTIQKEFTQRIANINDIATTTEYNTKRLLDGRYGNIQTKSGDGSINLIVSEPTNFVADISGNHTINKDGVYRLTGSANITINAKNVKFIQADSSVVIDDVYMTCANGGNSNLWIENLNIKNSQDKNFIKFQGENNFSASSVLSDVKSAIINVGQGLMIAGGDDGKGIFKFNADNLTDEEYNPNYFGAIIGSDGDEKSTANITVNSGIYIFSEEAAQS